MLAGKQLSPGRLRLTIRNEGLRKRPPEQFLPLAFADHPMRRPPFRTKGDVHYRRGSFFTVALWLGILPVSYRCPRFPQFKRRELWTENFFSHLCYVGPISPLRKRSIVCPQPRRNRPVIF